MTTRNSLDEAEQAAVAAAERLGVPLELIACDPAYADTAAFCAQYGYPVGAGGEHARRRLEEGAQAVRGVRGPRDDPARREPCGP